MEYEYQEKKITAIISSDLPTGLAMNALGHIAYSAGRYSDPSMMGIEKIIDKDGNCHRGISRHPFIALKASIEEIKEIVKKSKEKGNLLVIDYTQEMFDTAHDDELVEKLSQAQEPDVQYHAVILVGDSNEIKSLTSHLKLYR